MKGSHRLIVGALVASKPSSGAARQSEGGSQLTEPFLFRSRKLPPLSLRPWLPSLIVVGAIDPGEKGPPQVPQMAGRVALRRVQSQDSANFTSEDWT